MYNTDKPFMIERIVASFSYLTMGFAGFIWLLLSLFTRSQLRPFLQYHIFQSIFLSISIVLISILLGFIGNFLSIIPIINKIVAQIIFYLNMPFFTGFSIIQLFLYTLVIYLAITSFMGKYSYIPYISEIINKNIGR